MKNMTVPLTLGAAAVLITVIMMSTATHPVNSYAQGRAASNYAEDRSAIEDLQARYSSRSISMIPISTSQLLLRTAYSIMAAAT